MPETPPDKLMGWLAREEEEFGVTGAINRTIDADACRSMLEEELGYTPSDAQVDLMLDAASLRYGALPTVDTHPEIFARPWGKQSQYRDISTGRFISAAEVERRLEEIGYY